MNEPQLGGGLSGLRISEVVDALRMDLVESAGSRRPDWRPLFEIHEVEVELTCVVRQESEASGGIQFYVITVGSTTADEASVTQRVSLKLKPISADVPAARNPALRGGNAGR